jgi:glucose-1-phosphate thymidylyltransferase
MDPLKGLILSGGAGTRLRPITHTSAKQLVPVANKPVLFYGIEALVAAGVTEIVIVIAPETGGEIREAVGDGSAFGAQVTYVEQDAPRGLAHAVLTAEEALGSSPFVMYLGDNLLRDGISDLVDAFRSGEHDALLLLTEVDDPWHYGVAELDGERIVRLVEKPKDPPSNMALVGVYLFGPHIFDAARAIEPSGRGELEITDAIQHLIDDGSHVESRTVQGWWKDTGQLADMVEGRVQMAPGAVIERSIVRGPAIIGAGTRIIDSYVGPYTAIDEDVTIERSEIEHSIILSGCTVCDLESRMEASLLGKNVKLTRGESIPRTLSMIVGDRSEITLP